MTTYAIVLNTPDSSVWDFIKNRWTSHHVVSETLAFVSEQDPSALAANISEEIGMNKDKQVLGIVMPVSAYYGYNAPPLWEWLESAT